MMRCRFLPRIAGVALIALSLTACKADSELDERAGQANMALNEPVAIAHADGVTLWKVKDSTPGGALYVYFATSGDVVWEQKAGKTTQRYQVPGVTQ